MSKNLFWQLIPYLLPVLSYIIGKSRNKLRIPGKIEGLLKDQQVIDIVVQGIETVQSVQGKSDEEKREYVRSWAKSELYKLLGEWLPDSAINYLIEHIIVRRKNVGE